MMAMDNPLNGYVDGHTDGDYLGMFLLAPGAMHRRNRQPENNEINYLEIWNDFDDNNIFLTDYL